MSTPYPSISEEVRATLRTHLEKRAVRFPELAFAWSDVAETPRLSKTTVSEIRSRITTLIEDEWRRERNALGRVEHTNPAWSQSWEVECASYGTKSGVKIFQRVIADETTDPLVKRHAEAKLAFGERWSAMWERLDALKKAQATRAVLRAEEQAAKAAAVPQATREANERVRVTLESECAPLLEEWRVAYVAKRSAEILAPARAYVELEATRPGLSVAAYAAEISGLIPEKENMDARSIYRCKLSEKAAGSVLARLARVASEERVKNELDHERSERAGIAFKAAADMSRYFPVCPDGEAKAHAEAESEAADLRAQFLEKQASKLAMCAEAIRSIKAERLDVLVGQRLAARLHVGLVNGGGFILENDSVIKWAPVGRYLFAQFPSRFTEVRSAAAVEPLALVAEADMPALLSKAGLTVSVLGGVGVVAPDLPQAGVETSKGTCRPSL